MCIPSPTHHETVIKGRASARLLPPFLDDFNIDGTVSDATRLVGEELDRSHLHGLHAHLTSINTEAISVRPMGDSSQRIYTDRNTT